MGTAVIDQHTERIEGRYVYVVKNLRMNGVEPTKHYDSLLDSWFNDGRTPSNHPIQILGVFLTHTLCGNTLLIPGLKCGNQIQTN
jgi:hypothetical protein